jgi:hypothetical protein
MASEFGRLASADIMTLDDAGGREQAVRDET